MFRWLRAKLGLLSHDDVIRWIPWLFTLAMGVLAAVFIAYVVNFSPENRISDDPTAWGQFGDFVGGTANPLLGFLTLIGLLLTIALQGKQLDNSNKQLAVSVEELRETRRELARAAQAQENSQKELARQSNASRKSAYLASINLLLAQYRAEIEHLTSQTFVASDPKLQRVKQLQHKEVTLMRMLDDLFEDTISEYSTLGDS